MRRQLVTVLGSTGSIGRQALDVVRARSDRFLLFGISANENIGLLIEQAHRWKPRYVACRHPLSPADFPEGTVVLSGESALAELASLDEPSLVVNGISGLAALEPLLCALKAGKRVALANKESIVCGHLLVEEALRDFGGELIPVDSEHSAIFQCLQGSRSREEVRRVILTCSGGPFFGMSREEMAGKTRADALRHPNWSMGPKITVDCATLMNKGLEVIEAHYLFGMDADKIRGKRVCLVDDVISTGESLRALEKLVENAALIPFDQIMARAEECFFQRYHLPDYAVDAGATKRVIHIDRVRLGYMQMAAQNSGAQTLTPVWDFYGWEEYLHDDRKEPGTPNRQYSYLTINAIDGSMVDRALGY